MNWLPLFLAVSLSAPLPVGNGMWLKVDRFNLDLAEQEQMQLFQIRHIWWEVGKLSPHLPIPSLVSRPLIPLVGVLTAPSMPESLDVATLKQWFEDFYVAVERAGGKLAGMALVVDRIGKTPPAGLRELKSYLRTFHAFLALGAQEIPSWEDPMVDLVILPLEGFGFPLSRGKAIRDFRDKGDTLETPSGDLPFMGIFNWRPALIHPRGILYDPPLKEILSRWGVEWQKQKDLREDRLGSWSTLLLKRELTILQKSWKEGTQFQLLLPNYAHNLKRYAALRRRVDSQCLGGIFYAIGEDRERRKAFIRELMQLFTGELQGPKFSVDLKKVPRGYQVTLKNLTTWYSDLHLNGNFIDLIKRSGSFFEAVPGDFSRYRYIRDGEETVSSRADTLRLFLDFVAPLGEYQSGLIHLPNGSIRMVKVHLRRPDGSIILQEIIP